MISVTRSLIANVFHTLAQQLKGISLRWLPAGQKKALARDLGVETGLWSGLFTVQRGAKTAVHHHGEQETIAYVLKGECYVRWGERGEFSAVARQGSFIHVPVWLPHIEINQSLNSPFEWVVVRSTAAPIVVNLPDDYWN
jgi:uncharacterized RmlC-like cupin family protein